MITFGKVLTKVVDEEESFFIYLADCESGSYLARILSLGDTKLLEKIHCDQHYAKISLKTLDYTILQTKEFLGRAAVFGRLPELVTEYRGTMIQIYEEDLQKLKKGILESPHVAKELQKEIEKLEKVNEPENISQSAQ